MAKVSEAQTQRLILDWLAAKGILAFRMQSGATISSYKGKTRMFRYGTPGMADILAFTRQTEHEPSLPIWIEVKAPKGKQSDLQKSFEKQVAAEGHNYIVATSLEDVENWL